MTLRCIALALFLASCTGDTTTPMGCREASACAADEVCYNGACSRLCVKGDDCDPGVACVYGVCGSCLASDQCAGSFLCDTATGTCGTYCTGDGDCADTGSCQNGACVRGHDSGALCNADSECASGHCADDVCCQAACDGTCERCDS